ncbi:hypothetical protein LX36DRAFT_434168 [Colletotrichum falcatum]|nr:hypothetical protein LX36DRAFT_434168 [Colletotrichum falcatum]
MPVCPSFTILQCQSWMPRRAPCGAIRIWPAEVDCNRGCARARARAGGTLSFPWSMLSAAQCKRKLRRRRVLQGSRRTVCAFWLCTAGVPIVLCLESATACRGHVRSRRICAKPWEHSYRITRSPQSRSTVDNRRRWAASLQHGATEPCGRFLDWTSQS